MRKSWQGQPASAHGWNGCHFFVQGKQVCSTPGNLSWFDLRGWKHFRNRRPIFVKLVWDRVDCKKCTKIWLELYACFHLDNKRMLK